MSSRSKKIIEAAAGGNKSYHPPSFTIQQPSRKRKRDTTQSDVTLISPAPLVSCNGGSPARNPSSSTSEPAATRTPAATTKTPGFATPDALLVKQLERRRRAGEETVADGTNGVQGGAFVLPGSQDLQLLMAKMRFVTSTNTLEIGPLSRLLDVDNSVSLMMEESESPLLSPSAISLSLLLQQPGEGLNNRDISSSTSSSDPNQFDADTAVQAILSADPKLASSFSSWYSSSSSATDVNPWGKIEELIIQDWSSQSSSRQVSSSSSSSSSSSAVVTPKRRGRGQIRKLLIQGERDVSVMRGALNNGGVSSIVNKDEGESIKRNGE